MLHSGAVTAVPPERIKKSLMKNQLYCLLYRVLSVITDPKLLLKNLSSVAFCSVITLEIQQS